MATNDKANDDRARAAMVACMEHLDKLDPEDTRRVLRSLAIWFEDEDDRTLRAEGILEALGDIGQALRGEG